MSSYRLTFRLEQVEGNPDPLPALLVTDVDGPLDPQLRAAVLRHAGPRWDGAPLRVRISTERMRGRILAGQVDLRPIASFDLTEQHELDPALVDVGRRP